MTEMQYIMTPIKELIPYAQNNKKHSPKQIEQVSKSILEFGFLNAVICTLKGDIIAGHARVLAAKKLGLKQVPTLLVEHLTDEQVRAYRIADNKLAENSEWDEINLKHELEFLAEVNFDLSLTGFETPELDFYLNNEATENLDDDDIAIPETPTNTFVRLGDLFQAGQHRIICGDLRDEDTLRALMNGERAKAIFSDPPYNVKINGNVTTKTKTHDEFAFGSGEMDSSEFTGFLADAFQAFRESSLDGSLHYVCMDWRHMGEILAAGTSVYDHLMNVCVWAKTNAGMGSYYRSQHEFVFVFKKGNTSHQNNVQLGKYGRNRSNLWTYAGMTSFSKEREENHANHPTVKPVQMVVDAILDCTDQGDIVLDGFFGSGTTIVAAEKVGRIGYGCEISPNYVEVCLERLKAVSDSPIIHLETGLSLEDLKQLRQSKEA